jgi:hypothetical protein
MSAFVSSFLPLLPLLPSVKILLSSQKEAKEAKWQTQPIIFLTLGN